MQTKDIAHSAGRIVIDRHGSIVEADPVFVKAMRTETSLLGVSALSLTAPADRDRCRNLVEQICRDGIPVSTVKRMIRPDGTHLWLRNRLELLGDIPSDDQAEARIDVRLTECAPPVGWVQPSALLLVARLTFSSRRVRDDSFGADLFNDPGWDILLAAYISEAEGSVATISRVHAWTGIPLATASRWIRALSAEALLEYEDGGNHQLVTTPFRLTSVAHMKFERYLSEIYQNRTNAAQLALRSGQD